MSRDKISLTDTVLVACGLNPSQSELAQGHTQLILD